MLNYIILGIVQGIAEFFPISSSGHLAVLERLFGLSTQDLSLPLVLHLGTTLAVIVFFFHVIMESLLDRKMLLYIAIVTIVTGVIGLSGKSFFEQLFSRPGLIGLAWVVNGIILLATSAYASSARGKVTAKDSLLMGVAQGIAIIPGISRSGSTIAALLFSGLERNLAFRFSFVVSIPAVLGAALLESRHIDAAVELNKAGMLAGFIASFVSGLIALKILQVIMRRAKFSYFGYYCIAIGILTMLFVK